MSGGRKKRALRQCAICQKIGHNRTTCPERFVDLSKAHETPVAVAPTTTPAPLKFFVHHTTSEPKESDHRLNLKDHAQPVWSQVKSSAPTQPKNSAYYFHHNEVTLPIVPPEALSGEEAAQKELDEVQAVAPKENTPVNILYEQRPWQQRLYDLPFSLSQIFSKIKKPAAPKAVKETKPLLNFPTVKTQQREPLLLPAPLVKVTGSLHPPTPRPVAKKKPIDYKHLLVSKRSLAVALTLALVIAIFPLQAYVYSLLSFRSTLEREGQAGFAALRASVHSVVSADWSEAREQNTSALAHFSSALTELDTKHRTLQTIAAALPLVNTMLGSREKLLLAGQTLALGNAEVLGSLSTEPASSSTPERLLALAKASREALPLYTAAITNLSEVDPGSVPTEYRQEFLHYRELLNKAHDDLGEIAALAELIPDVFGGEGRRRYLIMFQNPAELRATGGFMGSFAFVEIYNGALVKLDVPKGGTYDLQGQLNAFVEPPAPLLLSNRRFEFQDANWFPDWPASAQKIAWFYRHSRGISVDGVIAINADLLPKLLSLLGPVTDSNRGTTWEADTALTQLQNLVEHGPDKAINQPKAVIGQLADTLAGRLSSLHDPAALSSLVSILNDALTKKDIQLAFFDSRLANIVKALGWDGSIVNTNNDQEYLLVTNSNIQGQKSDARIEQKISHQAVVDNNGNVDVTLTITRKHNGDPTENEYGATNISYLRVYVPLGSQLTGAEGFTWPDEKAFKAPLPQDAKDGDLLNLEKLVATDPNSGTQINESFGKTEFGNWIITEPGKESTVVLTYRLPFNVPLHPTPTKITDPEHWLSDANPIPYQLVVERQAGAKTTFSSKIIFPPAYETLWAHGDNATPALNGLTVNSTNLDSDRVYSLLTKEH